MVFVVVVCLFSPRSSRKSIVGRELPDPVFPRHFLQFHSTVLEPNFDLSVSQVHAFTDLQAALSSQVHVEQELFFQLQSLVLSVRATLLPAALCRQPVSRVVIFLVA